MDRGAWQATIQGVAELDTTDLTCACTCARTHTHTHTHTHVLLETPAWSDTSNRPVLHSAVPGQGPYHSVGTSRVQRTGEACSAIMIPPACSLGKSQKIGMYCCQDANPETSRCQVSGRTRSGQSKAQKDPEVSFISDARGPWKLDSLIVLASWLLMFYMRSPKQLTGTSRPEPQVQPLQP